MTEVFQSSRMSWSSKIIMLGSVESSQRFVGSVQASRYRWAYSSKSASSAPGGSSSPRRRSMYSIIGAASSSAYTWSPSMSSRSGHWSWGVLVSRLPSARSTSRPCVRLCSSSCGTLVRHEPNDSRSRRAGSIVRITLGGYGESGSGQRRSPSSSTVYGVLEPGDSPVTSTRA
jgi:hypothetical protein